MRIVYGTDLFRSREYLRHKVASPQFFDSNQVEEFVNASRQFNLFGVTETPVLVDGLMKLDEFQLDLIMNSNNPSVIWEKTDLKVTGVLKDKLSNADVVVFDPLSRIDLSQWIRQRGKHYSLIISPQLMDHIVDVYGNNLDYIDTELNKMHLYYNSSQNNAISLDNVTLSPIEGSIDIFAILDAIGNRDTYSVRSPLRIVLLQDDFHLFLGQLVGLIRRLIKTKLGETTSTYSFVVNKMKVQSEKWTLDELNLQLRLLLNLEFEIKKGITDFKSGITLWLFKNVAKH